MIEDDPWVGVVLHELVLEAAQAEVTILQSVAAAEKALAESEFDFAFLDVNVTDGQTFGIATDLMNHEVPFAFMSGFVDSHEVPDNLRHAPFIAKPFRAAQIKSILSRLPSL
jgi:DNA-binding NtrC family response regulator